MRSGLPDGVADLVERCLARDAGGRVTSAAEYALANPDTLGMGWFAVRAAIGMARCFRGLGLGREEWEELSRARELVASKAGFDFRMVWLSGDGELRFELATFEATANHPGEAARELADAVRCGWRALPRLETEPRGSGCGRGRRCSRHLPPSFRQPLDETGKPSE
jgi:hypothetical protein